MTLFKNQQNKLFGGRSNLNNKKSKLTGDKTSLTGKRRHFLENTDPKRLPGFLFVFLSLPLFFGIFVILLAALLVIYCR